MKSDRDHSPANGIRATGHSLQGVLHDRNAGRRVTKLLRIEITACEETETEGAPEAHAVCDFRGSDRFIAAARVAFRQNSDMRAAVICRDCASEGGTLNSGKSRQPFCCVLEVLRFRWAIG